MNDLSITRFERVMIIDDNQIDRYIATRTIIKSKFSNTVLEYSSATEALKYLQDNQSNTEMLPEIIFVDIYMPIMSGFEFMQAYDDLREPLKKYCRIFIISSTIDSDDITKVENDKNVENFHQKPITADFLRNVS